VSATAAKDSKQLAAAAVGDRDKTWFTPSPDARPGTSNVFYWVLLLSAIFLVVT